MTCPFGCPKIFTTKRNLQIHISFHGNDSKFTCNKDNCSFNCVNFAQMTRHLKIHYENLKKLNCMYKDCVMKFSTKFRLEIHERNHVK